MTSCILWHRRGGSYRDRCHRLRLGDPWGVQRATTTRDSKTLLTRTSGPTEKMDLQAFDPMTTGTLCHPTPISPACRQGCTKVNAPHLPVAPAAHGHGSTLQNAGEAPISACSHPNPKRPNMSAQLRKPERLPHGRDTTAARTNADPTNHMGTFLGTATWWLP